MERIKKKQLHELMKTLYISREEQYTVSYNHQRIS